VSELAVQPSPPTSGFVSRHRFILLFCALVVFYVLMPILHEARAFLHPALPPAAEGAMFLIMLLGTVVSISKGRVWIVFALLLGLPALVLWFVGFMVESDRVALRVTVVDHLFLAAFLVYVIWVMLRSIFDSRQVTFNSVCASLCVYLLLGLVWALFYSVSAALEPASFKYTVDPTQEPLLLRVFRGDSPAVLYFSFVTLTTLGYGDIVPTTPISRMLASIEAIVGQLYLAVLVARLVGMHIVHSMEQEKAEPAKPEAG